MSFRGARATRNPNDGSLLKISPFGRNDKNGGYSKLFFYVYPFIIGFHCATEGTHKCSTVPFIIQLPVFVFVTPIQSGGNRLVVDIWRLLQRVIDFV